MVKQIWGNLISSIGLGIQGNSLSKFLTSLHSWVKAKDKNWNARLAKPHKQLLRAVDARNEVLEVIHCEKIFSLVEQEQY